MKTTFILLLGMLMLSSCKEASDNRYTQDAPEIDLYKKSFDDYTSQNWEGLRSYYADTARLHFNTTESNPMTIDDAIADNKEMAEMLSEYGFIDGSAEFERVITDDGELWVNYWGDWYGVIAASGKRIEIPVHLTARFVDSKIVQEHGFWDTFPIYMAIMEAENEEIEDVIEGEETFEEE
tara:strand:+ start:4285 stop:4824 length:540 start_codon:yes stop_codon:yes gene_type:complete